MSVAAEALAAPTADPVAWGARLAVVYREIGLRAMRDLPIYHEALVVEAIGFRTFQARCLGILITPWFMNLVMAIEQGASAEALSMTFPVGTVTFTPGDAPTLGPIATCSLFSPMFEFEDMEAARITAAAVFDALMTPPATDDAMRGKAAIDRRAFLRGGLEPRP